MSHIVPVRDYSGSPDPLAAIHAARLERQRRLAAAAYAPPPPPPKVKTEPAPKPVVPVEDVLARYRLAVNTFDPVIRLERLASVPKPIDPWQAAVAIVCRETGAKARDMSSRRRYQKVAVARQIVFWLMRNCTTLSFPAIGRASGGFDHSTIINACTRIEKRRIDDPAFRAATARMQDELAGLLA